MKYNLRMRPIPALIWRVFGSTGNAPDYSFEVLTDYWAALIRSGEMT